MPPVKLTKRVVDTIQPVNKDLIVWDTEIKGFGCKITPQGNKSYFLYYRTKDGRQRRPKIGIHGVITCEQAREIAQQWLAEVTKGQDPSAVKQELRSAPTVKELFERYMQEHAPHKKQSSQIEDKRLGEKYIISSLGSIKVCSLLREDIVKVHAAMRSMPTNANRMLSLFSKMLSLAEVWGYRPDHSNPCRHIKKYPENKRERFLSQEEIIRLQQVLFEEESQKIEMPSVLCAIRLLLLTGCRLNEILTLRWKEVDFEKKCLFLSDSKVGKRTVYLSPQAIDLLSSISSSCKEKDNPYVITGKKHGAHLINLQKPWRRIRKKVGLEEVRIHDLRHTFASVAAANGLSLPIIGALLGHTQTQTTARYAHLVGKPMLEAVERIGQQMGKNK